MRAALLERWIEGDAVTLPAGEALTLVKDGPIAHLVVNRPDKRNAINAAMWSDISRLMTALDADAGVRLVVLRGAGRAAFSAGADISEFRQIYSNAELTERQNAEIRRAQLAVERLSKPTLAVVHGACIGGGCGLALSCDLRFAGAGARFGITASKLGVGYSVPDTRRLVALVGSSRAKDILFSGRLMDAAEALAIGLIDRVAEDATIERVAADYARLLLANSSESIATAKALINSLSGVAPQPEEVLEARYAASFASADFAEGFRAFQEKRPPRFG